MLHNSPQDGGRGRGEGVGGLNPSTPEEFQLNIVLSFDLFLPPVKPKCREWHMSEGMPSDRSAASGLAKAP